MNKNWTLREELAKERYLDLMVAKGGAGARVNEIAEHAVAEADALIVALAGKPHPLLGLADTKMVGCRPCFGSGGKRNRPCKVCHGVGKVEVHCV